MTQVDLYPCQTLGSPLDSLDISFIVFYLCSVRLTAVEVKLLRISWCANPDETAYGKCFHSTESGVCNIYLYGNRSPRETMATLLHELAHAQQFHSGKLRHRTGHWYWCGKSFKVTKQMRTILAKYRLLPWEIEADELTALLFKSLVNDGILSTHL